MKIEIKTVPIESDYKCLNTEEMENKNRLTKMVTDYSKTIKKIEEKYQIDNIVIRDFNEFSEEAMADVYYHNENTYKKKSDIEKVEITVGSENEMNSLTKALNVAVNYLENSNDKYDCIDNITVMYNYECNSHYIRLNLYLHKK